MATRRHATRDRSAAPPSPPAPRRLPAAAPGPGPPRAPEPETVSRDWSSGRSSVGGGYDPSMRTADGTGAAGQPPGNPSGSVMNFGRYAGWSLGEIARSDLEYLEWLDRMPIGRPVSRRDRRDPAAGRAASLGGGRQRATGGGSSAAADARSTRRDVPRGAVGAVPPIHSLSMTAPPSSMRRSYLIELFVVLLGIAAIVAIVARPLRLPHTVALVAVGLLIGALAGPLGVEGGLEVTPELVLLVLLPGLVFEAAYRLRLSELRRWFSALLLLAVPGVLDLGRDRGPGPAPGDGPARWIWRSSSGRWSPPPTRRPSWRRSSDCRSTASLATIVDGESLLNDGTGLVLFAIAVRAVAEPVGLGRRDRRHSSAAVVGQRRHRAGGGSSGRPPRRRGPGPPGRAHDLGRPGLRHLSRRGPASTSRA